MPGQEGALALAGEEAEVLALALGGDREARRAAASSRTSGLVRSASGKRRRGKRLRPQRGQHVGLVLGGVGRRGEQRALAVVGDAGVVARGERRGPQPLGEGEHRVDPQLAVADHAGVRASAPPRGRAGSRRRRWPETRPRGRASGGAGRVAWASARAPTTASGEQQLRAPSVCRSAHSFRVTATTSAPRSRSSSAATAESTPPLIATSTRSAARRRIRKRLARRGRGAERAVKGVGGELGRVAALRREPAERGGDRRPARCAPRPARWRPRPPRRPRRRRAIAAAQPSASKRAAATRPPSTRERDAHQVAARRSAGGAAERAVGRRAAPRVVVQVVLERLEAHLVPERSCRRRAATGPRLAPSRPPWPLPRVVRQVRRALVEGVADRLARRCRPRKP